MSNKYEIKDILSAVNALLKNEKKTPYLLDKIKPSNEKKLKLINEVKNTKVKLTNVPENTEKIILQAEKYLKK
tara:strand:- start:642 stop:860 length:219 start_codon:yes stop_codon:yes gene_type:complete